MAMEFPLIFRSPNTDFVIDLKTLFTFVALVLSAVAAFVTKWKSLSVSALFRSTSVISHPSYSYSCDDDSSDEESYSSDDGSDDDVDSEEEEDDESSEPQGQDGNYDYDDDIDWTGRSSVVKLWEGRLDPTRKVLIHAEDWDSSAATWRGEREEEVYYAGDLRNVGPMPWEMWRRSEGVVAAASEGLWGSSAAMRLMLFLDSSPVRKM